MPERTRITGPWFSPRRAPVAKEVLLPGVGCDCYYASARMFAVRGRAECGDAVRIGIRGVARTKGCLVDLNRGVTAVEYQGYVENGLSFFANPSRSRMERRYESNRSRRSATSGKHVASKSQPAGKGSRRLARETIRRQEPQNRFLTPFKLPIRIGWLDQVESMSVTVAPAVSSMQ